MVTRSFTPLLVVTAALVFGGAVVIGFASLTDDVVRVLAAVAVAAVGAGVALLPGVDGVARAAGTGLVAFGAVLLGSTASADVVRYGLPALVLLGLAATGPRLWLSAAGVLIALTLPDNALPALAVLLTVVVVCAPARAWWGDLAGAVAGAAVLIQDSVVVATVAVVLLMAAAVRRDLVTGLLAATVLAVPDPEHAWPLGAAVVVALVAIRVPAVRAVATRVPALRGTRPAHAAAGAAVVVGAGLLGVALQLPLWWLTLVAVLVAGALGHWLPAPSGPALAVVALVGLGLGRPWADLVPALDLVMAFGALPLLRRHPVPPVFAATAYLLLRVIPPVLGPEPVVAALLPVLLLGAAAAVLALGRRTAPVSQAVGAVVLGATAFWQVTGLPNLLGERVSLVLIVPMLALGVSTGWRPSAPLAATVAVTLYGLMTLAGGLVTAVGAVVAALVVAAAALVVAAVFTARLGPRAVSRDR